MFDDLFLFAACEQAIEDKRVLLLSVRQESDFDVFHDFNWRVAVQDDIMIREALSGDFSSLEIVLQGVESQSFSAIMGDLAAFTPQKIDYVRSIRPAVVKASFVTSPIDGQAFLPPQDSDKMPEMAASLMSDLRSMDYTVLASTWYRNDAQIRIWETGEDENMDRFPFNIVAFQDTRLAAIFGFMAAIFTRQEEHISKEHRALEQRLNAEIENRTAYLQDSNMRNDRELKREIDIRNTYIKMLEDAMIALQPSEKIKLG